MIDCKQKVDQAMKTIIRKKHVDGSAIIYLFLIFMMLIYPLLLKSYSQNLFSIKSIIIRASQMVKTQSIQTQTDNHNDKGTFQFQGSRSHSIQSLPLQDQYLSKFLHGDLESYAIREERFKEEMNKQLNTVAQMKRQISQLKEQLDRASHISSETIMRIVSEDFRIIRSQTLSQEQNSPFRRDWLPRLRDFQSWLHLYPQIVKTSKQLTEKALEDEFQSHIKYFNRENFQ